MGTGDKAYRTQMRTHVTRIRQRLRGFKVVLAQNRVRRRTVETFSKWRSPALCPWYASIGTFKFWYKMCKSVSKQIAYRRSSQPETKNATSTFSNYLIKVMRFETNKSFSKYIFLLKPSKKYSIFVKVVLVHERHMTRNFQCFKNY